MDISVKFVLTNIRIYELPIKNRLMVYLAGTTRTRETGSKIGVHSWSDGGSKEATDFPVGHANHQPYIEYYEEMGFSKDDAEAFYYFTIHAAKAADIHWMTDAEIAQYKLLAQ